MHLASDDSLFGKNSLKWIITHICKNFEIYSQKIKHKILE